MRSLQRLPCSMSRTQHAIPVTPITYSLGLPIRVILGFLLEFVRQGLEFKV